MTNTNKQKWREDFELGDFVSSFTESNQEIIKMRQWLKDYEELLK